MSLGKKNIAFSLIEKTIGGIGPESREGGGGKKLGTGDLTLISGHRVKGKENGDMSSLLEGLIGKRSKSGQSEKAKTSVAESTGVRRDHSRSRVKSHYSQEDIHITSRQEQAKVPIEDDPDMRSDGGDPLGRQIEVGDIESWMEGAARDEGISGPRHHSTKTNSDVGLEEAVGPERSISGIGPQMMREISDPSQGPGPNPKFKNSPSYKNIASLAAVRDKLQRKGKESSTFGNSEVEGLWHQPLPRTMTRTSSMLSDIPAQVPKGEVGNKIPNMASSGLREFLEGKASN